MKILKKSLAIFLTLALCLSAMLGCLAVSAEGTALTLVLDKDTYAPGETVRIAVNAADFADIKGAQFQINLGALTNVSVEAGLITLVEDNEEVEPNVWVNGSTVKFVDTFADVTEGTLFTVVATAPAVGSYEVTVSDAKFGISATELADIAVAPVTVVVEEAHVCDMQVNKDETGHWTECTCGIKTDVVPHTFGEYTDNGDGTETATCECGWTDTRDVVVECTHNWEVVTATAASHEKISGVWTETGKGSIELKCSVCGEEVTKEVSYNDTYKAAGGSMSLEAQIIFSYFTYDSVIKGADTVIFKTFMDTADPEDLLAYTKLEDAKSTTNNGQSAKTVDVGVPAKYMTEPLSIYVFVEKDGVWYSGRERAYSVAEIAQLRASSAGVLEKKMYAALLTYGAKAQLAFKYKTDDLADSAENLGGFAAYVPAEKPVMVDDLDLGNVSGTVRYKGCYYNLEAATALGINLRTDKVTPTPDVSKISVDVEYIDYAGETQTITYSEFTNSATDTYTFEFAKLSVREWRNQFTMSVKYDGVANGSTLGGTIAGLAKWYSKQSGCPALTATALEAMIAYGDAASEYFDSLS